jgi:hypothetical protein
MTEIINIYELGCYKTVLRKRLMEKRRFISGKYTLAKMAQACRVQSTYLSRVLNQEKPQLNEDQLYSACNFLGFNPDEQEYLFLLRSIQTCDLLAREEQLMNKLQVIRTRHTRTENSLVATKKSTDIVVDDRYYLDPDYILVHACLAIKGFANRPIALADALEMSKEKVISILSLLESCQLIAMVGEKVVLKIDALHLPRNSELFEFYRTAQRLAALEKIRHLGEKDSYNFSVTFTSNSTAMESIKFEFQKFLKVVQRITQSTEDEDAYQMNFDLFRWTKS